MKDDQHKAVGPDPGIRGPDDPDDMYRPEPWKRPRGATRWGWVALGVGALIAAAVFARMSSNIGSFIVADVHHLPVPVGAVVFLFGGLVAIGVGLRPGCGGDSGYPIDSLGGSRHGDS